MPALPQAPSATHGPAETADALHGWFHKGSPLQFRALQGRELCVIGVRRGRPALTLIEMEDGNDAQVASFVEKLFAELRSRGRIVATEHEPIPPAIRRALFKGVANAFRH